MISFRTGWHDNFLAMKKPAKKRTGDSVQVAYSVMQDVVGISNKPIVAPSKARKKKRKK
jgi:hypothetical protein